MNLTILTPEEEVFNGEITSIKVPGVNGQFQVFKGHAPLVSSLARGYVSVKTADNKEESFHIVGGFIEVLNNSVAVLVRGLVTEEVEA